MTKKYYLSTIQTTTEAEEIAEVAEDSPVEVAEAEAEEEAAADVARDLIR